MSHDDPRREAADIARALRRNIERERAAGRGELLASSMAAARGRGVPTPGGDPSAAATTAERAAVTAPAPEERESAATRSRGSASIVRDEAPAADVSLFGEEPARGSPHGFAYELPSHFEPLHPVDLAERAHIWERALPVLDGVAAEARACRACGLCDTRTNAVPGVGSARRGIVFVGEAPGADEDAQGEPFVGRAGQLLTKIIAGMDERRLIPGVKLDRETVYICNVLKCRPPENRNPLPHEVEACSPYVRRQLDALKPRIICCLGKFAAELLVGVKGTIASMRGKIYRYQGAKLIVTYHPAACLRNPGYKQPVWEDMQMLAREYMND